MPKPQLAEPFNSLEGDLIRSLQAGLKEWRPDLNYPESYPDMQACVRGILRMFEIKRATLPIKLEYHHGIDYEPHNDAGGNVLCQFCDNSFHVIFGNIPLCTKHYKIIKQE